MDSGRHGGSKAVASMVPSGPSKRLSVERFRKTVAVPAAASSLAGLLLLAIGLVGYRLSSAWSQGSRSVPSDASGSPQPLPMLSRSQAGQGGEALLRGAHRPLIIREGPHSISGRTAGKRIVCSAEEARHGADYLLRGHRVGMDELVSGRHLDDWARAMALIDARPAKVLVSVGMGSGFDFARWLGRWRPELGICEATWHERILSLSSSSEGGKSERPCELLETWASKDSQLQQQPTVLIGVEPSRKTVHLAQKVLDGLLEDRGDHNVKALLVWGAVADSTGEAMFTDCDGDQGEKGCGIGGGEGSVRVPLVTVDSLVKQHYDVVVAAGGVIDVLAIDAGGYEPLVIEGARQMLTSQRVRVIKFEYQPLGPWDSYQLGDVVDDLDGLGYDCYFEADHRVVRLTGCWHEDFEFHVWSTVTCVVRGDPWRWVMEDYRIDPVAAPAEPQS